MNRNMVQGTVLKVGGTLINGRYTIRRYRGGGKYAEVYAAIDQDIKSTDGGDYRVAIKILRPEYWSNEEVKQRFAREGALQKLGCLGDHNKIVKVLRDGLTHRLPLPNDNKLVDVPFLVMEYVEHITLQDYLEEHGGTVPIDATLLLIIQQLSGALDWIHKQGVVHRDLAAHNILLRCEEQDAGCRLLTEREDFVQLTDFGLAFKKDEGTITQDRRERIAANVLYASPEILYGNIPTAQDDLYSLGTLVFRLLAGRFPFPCTKLKELEDLWEYAALVGSCPVAFPNPEAIPIEVRKIIIQAMEKERAKRFCSANEMAENLIPALQQWDAFEPLPQKAMITTDVEPSPQPVSPSGKDPDSKTQDGKITEEHVKSPPTRRKKIGRFGCNSCLVVLIAGILAILLIVGTLTNWWSNRSTANDQVPRLTPIEEQGAHLPPVDAPAPELTVPTPNANASVTMDTPISAVENTPAPAPATPEPAQALITQAQEIAFAYVSQTGEVPAVMGQPSVDDRPDFPLFHVDAVPRSLRWSPNEDLLAYTANTDGLPAVCVTDGVNARRLSPPGVAERWPTWSRDGAALVVATGDDQVSHLSHINVSDGTHAPLTGDIFNAWAPSWSPTEDYIAFVSDMAGDNDIYVWSLIEPDNPPVNISCSGNVIQDSPAWAPDGKWLIYTTSEGLYWVSIENLEPGTPHAFTTNGQDRAPCFLNEREILFQRTSGAGTVSIHQGRLGNDTQQRVVDNASWPACRPWHDTRR